MSVDGAELRDADIAVEDGWITAVGHRPDAYFDETIDCSRFIATPGLVNTHHHLYQTLTRGFPESDGRGLFDWLTLLYPIWAGLDEEMIFDSTRCGLAELALSGCTTCADHLYVFPPGSERFIDAEIAAAREVGLRFHATRGSMDLGEEDGGLPPQSVVQTRETILRDSERLIDTYHDPTPGAMINVGLAPCSPFSVTPELMRETAQLSRQKNVRLHTHIAETADEDAYSRQNFGLSPIELLATVDWLGPDVWVAHCVHPSPTDVDRIVRAGVSVAHCPTSNMLLGSGLAPIRELLIADVAVGLGVDGSASNDANDLRMEVKQAVLAARSRDGVQALTVRDALRLGTRGGAGCLGREDIGRLEAGATADIALWDADSLEMAGGWTDPVAALVLASVKPDSVIVHGHRIVADGQLLTADVDDVARRLNRSSGRLLSNYA